MVSVVNEVRWEQSHSQLERLKNEFVTWHGVATGKVNAGQYRTQFAAIHTLVTGATDYLLSESVKVDRGQDGAYVFQICREFDTRTQWIRRIWGFFRDKYDQRNDQRTAQRGPYYGDLLLAADNVTWSCYDQAFKQAEAFRIESQRGTPPLPFIESRYGPTATPTNARFIPPDLLAELDKYFQAKFLGELPIPLLSVPSSYDQAPWWLVVLGHEVGHHIAFKQFGGKQLGAAFQEAVKGAVKGEAENVVTAWQSWSDELIADVLSIFLVGPSAIKAMSALEFAGPRQMRETRDKYPPAVVRLAFLTKIADISKLGGKSALGGIDLDKIAANDSQIAHDWGLADKVAEAATRSPFGALSRSLADLCGFNKESFGPYGSVVRWKGELDGHKPVPDQNLPSARWAASAAWEAWEAEVTRTPEPPAESKDRKKWATELSGRLTSLATAATQLMIDCGATGERAAGDPDSVVAKDLGIDFGKALLGANSDWLLSGGRTDAF
jgi:hypothetical protein